MTTTRKEQQHMSRNPVLTVGEVYTNRNGSAYRCTSVSGPGRAILERVTDRWTLLTHGITVYEDGTIEWDYSTGGHWPY